MELEDVLARIESRLKAVGLSAHAASLAAGRPDAIRNLKRAVKNHDRRGVTTETLLALAPVLKTSAAWLLEGISEQTSSTLIPVVGWVGAGGEIQPSLDKVPPEGLYEIEVPFPLPVDAVALQVEGANMWPRYDPGDVIVFRRQGNDVQEVVGREAALRIADDHRYLRRVQPGATMGTFDLESHNAAPIRAVRIVWAAEIKGVVRSGQFRRR